MWVWIERILIAVITVTVTRFAGLLASKYTKLEKKEEELAKKETAIENGVKALLRDRITQMYNYCIGRGYMTIHDRENLERMFEEYERLGGNGIIGGLVQRLFALPTSVPQLDLDSTSK